MTSPGSDDVTGENVSAMLDTIPNTSQRTAYGPDDVGSGCPAVPPLGWQSRLGGRLGLHRRPKPTRTTPSTGGLGLVHRRPEKPTRTTPSTGEADSDYTVDRRGRLGIHRRPEPTRTTPSTGADSDYTVDRSRLGLHRRPEPTRTTPSTGADSGYVPACHGPGDAVDLPRGP
jgi:hypothetical protein